VDLRYIGQIYKICSFNKMLQVVAIGDLENPNVQRGINIARLPSLEVVPLGLTGKPQLWCCDSSYLLVTPEMEAL
jgi:hypothetical protein